MLIPIDFVISGATFSAPPSGYLYQKRPGSGPISERCFGIQSWSGPFILLGDIFLQQVFLGYDFVNGLYGFAERTPECELNQLAVRPAADAV